MTKANIEEKYYLDFGLEKDPFPVSLTYKNIFLTPEINRRLKYFKQVIARSKKLLLVTSLSGAGKSLLAEKLLVLADKDWQCCSLTADEKMDIEALSFQLVQQLIPDQKIESKLAVSMLHKYLETSYKEKVVPVLVIDDADKLQFETLQFLLQLADLQYNDAIFRIVLFANESITETLAKAGLKELADDTVQSINMPGFRPDQIEAYLKFRLSSCGKNIELPFSNQDISYIHSVSGGLPASINLLARQLMIESSASSKPQKSYAKLSLLLSAIIIALAIYIYQEKYLVDIADTYQASIKVPSPPVVSSSPEVATEAENELVKLGDSISLKLSELQIPDTNSAGEQ